MVGQGILHLDNAPIHKANKTREIVGQLTIEPLLTAPYSLDATPLDVYLNVDVKPRMPGIHPCDDGYLR